MCMGDEKVSCRVAMKHAYRLTPFLMNGVVWSFVLRSWLLYQEQSCVPYKSMIGGSNARKSNEKAPWPARPGCFFVCMELALCAGGSARSTGPHGVV